MSADVKPRRRYDSPHRREQAAGTRRKIVAAAQPLFLEHGYAGTTMAVIARDAGVVVETVYRSFGSKVALFGAVVEAALAGGVERAEVPVEERPAIAALIAEPDPPKQVAMYAATQPGIHRRAGPLLRAVRDASALDPEVARVWSELEGQRYFGQGRFAGMLASRGALRDGLTVERATDRVWVLTALDVHDMLVIQRGWSSDEYERWLVDALTRELLPAPALGRSRRSMRKLSSQCSRRAGWMNSRFVLALSVILLAGCSGFGLFATPLPHLPELPEQQAFPDLTVEALVEELEADGFECADVPDSDISGWVGCTDVDDPELRPRHLIELRIRPHAGPVLDVYASLYGDWDAAQFDELAAVAFHDALISHLFDEDVAPDLAAFTDAVRDNQPKLIEDVWLFVFGKSSNVRTLRVTYHGS